MYDSKDVVLLSMDFYRTLMSSFNSLIVSLIEEMITISDKGALDFVMNVLLRYSFACIAALVYHNERILI